MLGNTKHLCGGVLMLDFFDEEKIFCRIGGKNGYEESVVRWEVVIRWILKDMKPVSSTNSKTTEKRMLFTVLLRARKNQRWHCCFSRHSTLHTSTEKILTTTKSWFSGTGCLFWIQRIRENMCFDGLNMCVLINLTHSTWFSVPAPTPTNEGDKNEYFWNKNGSCYP